MNSLPNLEDLNIFVQVAKRASFAAVAEQLGMSAAFISKRVRLLEQQMGVRLLHRTTRRVSLSEEGERVYQWALQIFETVQRMGDDISTQHRVPVGQLRIASSLGLGRRFVAPALSELAERYPQLDIRLDVHDRLVDLIEEGRPGYPRGQRDCPAPDRQAAGPQPARAVRRTGLPATARHAAPAGRAEQP